MRLDKFLKVARIIKRRTVANDACDAEHVNVNGRRAKASYDVKIGDEIEITFGERVLKLRVLDVKEHVAKADASSMYEIIS
ncbi:MAG: RNA-binding S4 domain-containing protein [Ruminococcaceae bacterium]|nr:RNA-binding S4 domain-containing protein [Oscillospiraceae bacterium]